MTKDEALKMCLEYIETDAHERKYVRHAIKEALANEALDKMAENARELGLDYEPAQRTWVGLTDEEAQQTFAKHNCTISTHLAGILARAIEAKLKEKNI